VSPVQQSEPKQSERGLNARFVDLSGKEPNGPSYWAPVKVSRRSIEEAIARLADRPAPANGRRAMSIVHPSSVAPGLGLAPGVEVVINVLKPGESTRPMRRNANQAEICIAGSGMVAVKDKKIELSKWDVCNIPSMQSFAHHNTGDDLWVCLTYSNAPLLEKMGVNYFEVDPKPPAARPKAAETSSQYNRETAPDMAIGESGARLRGYEFLTDIKVVDNVALHWPWSEVSRGLATQVGDNKRNIMLMYNPATERRNGTTHSFFVTAFSSPPGTPTRPVGRGHRHSSVAINYHFFGRGKSIVDGEVIEWEAGDLLLSAPGWSEHAHYYSPEGAMVFTVQDHPAQIGMESLIWQERMDGPILALGSDAGQTGYIGPREKGE
jgi:gentisate 1,2-dioxygenase